MTDMEGKLGKMIFLLTVVMVSARPKSITDSSISFANNVTTLQASRPRGEPFARHSLPNERNNLNICRKPAKCLPLNHTTCFGVKLQFSHTTFDLVSDSTSQEDVQEKLLFWQSLKSVPKCWAVIQPFLCALYVPRCENGYVELPSQEMCRVIRNPCRIVELEHREGWPDFMKCGDQERFPSGCKNEMRELKFNTTAKCQGPLVESDNSLAFLEGVEGCGLPCENPLFRDEEHEQVQRFTATLAGLCLACTAFAVATFLIDWRSASRYPAVIIFYMNACFVIACVGWLAQFFPNARKDITCRKDGTPRVAEPSAGENLSCVVVFIMIYYFLMAACVWFVMLSYAWYTSFKAIGKIREKVGSKAAYFHLVSWSVPLVLTITCMALAQVKAQSPHGICFVDGHNVFMRSGFVLAPVLLSVFIAFVFLIKGLMILVKLKMGSTDVVSPSASAKLRDTITRISAFALCIVLSVSITIACHVYEFQHQTEWITAFRSYMVCLANQTTSRILHHGWAEDCELETRPSMIQIQSHLIAVFGTGIAISSWVWTKATAIAWRRWYRRVFRKQPMKEQVRIRKHKIIAQAFAKRRDLSHMGRMSISIHSTHDDPVGLNIDLNSAASNDVSSAWAAAIPKFVTRRGAVVGTAGAFGLRRNSLDSEISLSAVRRISVESQSRRHSLDSHHSLNSIQSHTLDLERLTRLHMRRGARSARSKRSFLRTTRKDHFLKRRGSSTSQASSNSKGSQILPAITKHKELFLSRLSMSTNGGASAAALEEGKKESKKEIVDVEKIERFSLNLPGQGTPEVSSDDEMVTNPTRANKALQQSVSEMKVTRSTQATQTMSVWDTSTQTTPSLSRAPAVGSKKRTALSKGTQISMSMSSISSQEEKAANDQKVSPKLHKERGKADGSPDTSSSDGDEDSSTEEDESQQRSKSPSQALLDYLLPSSSSAVLSSYSSSAKKRNRRSREERAADAGNQRLDALQLDRNSLAKLLEKLRESEQTEDRPKRSYDRYRSKLDRSQRTMSERHEDDENAIELDYLLSSKNSRSSNRSDRSKKSERKLQPKHDNYD